MLVIAGLELPPLVTYKLARLKDENGGEWSGNEDDEGNNLGKGLLFVLGGSFPTWRFKFEENLCSRLWIFFIYFFSFRLFVGSAWSIGFFIPATTANDLRLWRIFYPRFYPFHLFSYLNSWERASIFPFECSVLNKGTTGTIFITSLVLWIMKQVLVMCCQVLMVTLIRQKMVLQAGVSINKFRYKCTKMMYLNKN